MAQIVLLCQLVLRALVCSVKWFGALLPEQAIYIASHVLFGNPHASAICQEGPDVIHVTARSQSTIIPIHFIVISR